jgi:hypothetical protein
MTEYYNNNSNLKSSQVKINFTEEQIAEYIKCKDNPIYFINNYCKIVSLDDGLIPFKLFDYQIKFINAMHMNNRVICKAFRQSGKCLKNDTFLTIRNKITGEIKTITAESLHKIISN